MSAFWNILRHKYLGVAATVTMLLLLPVALFVSQQPQDPRGAAEKATILAFSPLTSNVTPLEVNVGDQFPLTMMITPGKDLVRTIEIDITYDPASIRLSSEEPIEINEDYFPEVLEGPIYTNGRVKLALSIGSEFTKTLNARTKVLTLNFRAINSTESTLVKFGSDTSVYSLESSDSSENNVLSTTIPAFLIIK